jgi:hypothetical protein
MEECRLAEKFAALPLGMSLWSYAFLTPDGDLIQTEWVADETTRTRDTKELICAIAIAARRFPQTGTLRPVSVRQLLRLSPLSGNRTLW